jgi:dihydroorotate dehydrogenase (NAD+) catalytic subunit
MPDLAVQLGPLRLVNPVICGSGEHVATRDDIVAAVDAGAAAVVAKSANESEAARRQYATVAQAFIGPGHEVVEPDGTASILNRSGLVPVPWDEWLETLARADAYARERDRYVAASIIPGDTAALAQLAGDVEAAGLRWLELNLSAPHAHDGIAGAAIERPAAAERAAELTGIVRAATALPLSVKLGIEHHDVTGLAAAVREAGADIVVMTGRHMGFLPDLQTRRPVLGSFGGYSGPWALPLTLRWVAKTRRALPRDVPLVATNGVRGGGDVARALLAGASAVQAASSVIAEGPAALTRMVEELERYLEEQGASAQEIVGEAADAVLGYEEAAMKDAG